MNTIQCEGLIAGSALRIIYKYNYSYKRQIKVYCSDDYEACGYYQWMMAQKYSDK